MQRVHPKQLEEFTEACHRVARHGLVRCSSGNMSLRLNAETMLVSGTQSWLADIHPEQVAVCRITDGLSLNGIRPSVEARFHAGILRTRREVTCVLHFQGVAATTLACRSGEQPDFSVILEAPFYIGPVAWIPFLMPGSEQLAEAVVAAAAEHDMVMLRNHGQVTVGETPAAALQRAAFFELASRIILDNGERVTHLPAERAAGLREIALRGKGGA